MIDNIDMYYEEDSYLDAERFQEKKLLKLYYDCAAIIDKESCADDYGILIRAKLNQFFRDNLNKTL